MVNGKIPKVESHCTCLSMTLIDSVLKMDKNYYSQVSSEACKYIITEKNMKRYIKDDIEISFNGEIV